VENRGVKVLPPVRGWQMNMWAIEGETRMGICSDHSSILPQPPPDDPGNPTVNFHGEKRSNETHASKTDPEALRARKSEGKESKLSYSGNLLVENRNGLIVDAEVFQVNGTTKRDGALVMTERIPGTQARFFSSLLA
jgi:hypothetical protein